jgi:hypothetical protein
VTTNDLHRLELELDPEDDLGILEISFVSFFACDD